MYDLLTREQLHTLHEMLFLVGQSIYNLMFTEDDRPAMSVSSDEWQRLYAAHRENSAAMRAAYAEIERRDKLASMADEAAEAALEVEAWNA